MTFKVRVIAYRGIQQLNNVLPKQFSSDSVYQLVQPPEWSQALQSNAATVVSSAPVNVPNDQTQLLRVEVPDACAIRYEINPPGTALLRTPGDASPILSGHDNF